MFFKVARFLSHLPTKYFSFCDEGARNVVHFGRRGSIIVHKKKTSYSKSSPFHRKWWILIFPKNTQKQLLLVLIFPCRKVCRLAVNVSLYIFVSHFVSLYLTHKKMTSYSVFAGGLSTRNKFKGYFVPQFTTKVFRLSRVVLKLFWKTMFARCCETFNLLISSPLHFNKNKKRQKNSSHQKVSWIFHSPRLFQIWRI